MRFIIKLTGFRAKRLFRSYYASIRVLRDHLPSVPSITQLTLRQMLTFSQPRLLFIVISKRANSLPSPTPAHSTRMWAAGMTCSFPALRMPVPVSRLSRYYFCYSLHRHVTLSKPLSNHPPKHTRSQDCADCQQSARTAATLLSPGYVTCLQQSTWRRSFESSDSTFRHRGTRKNPSAATARHTHSVRHRSPRGWRPSRRMDHRTGHADTISVTNDARG